MFDSKPTIFNFADLVEENGKTIRENNSEKTHKYPLGTKLKIKLPYEGDENGDDEGMEIFMPGIEGTVTCYVVRHDRDCDMTPLYAISPYEKPKLSMDPEEKLWDWITREAREYTLPKVYWLLALSDHKVESGYPEEFITQHLCKD